MCQLSSKTYTYVLMQIMEPQPCPFSTATAAQSLRGIPAVTPHAPFRHCAAPHARAPPRPPHLPCAPTLGSRAAASFPPTAAQVARQPRHPLGCVHHGLRRAHVGSRIYASANGSSSRSGRCRDRNLADPVTGTATGQEPPYLGPVTGI
jgi:hypothetical protein